MPQRFLRPGIRNSAKWNSVSLIASKLYISLLTLVDDYGQYEGRASVIWSDCFTVWNELHPLEQIDLAASCCALQQLSDAFMVEIFEGSNGKKYLQVLQWQERVRDGCRPKWMENGVEYVKLQQVAASCCKILPPSPTPSSIAFVPRPSPTPTPSNGACEPPSGFPKNENEAVEAGISGGVDDATCRECYHKAVGRGYRDGADVPIRNFQSHVKSVSMRKQADRVEKGLPATPKPKPLKSCQEFCVVNVNDGHGNRKLELEHPPTREMFPVAGQYDIALDAFEDWKKKRQTGFYERA